MAVEHGCNVTLRLGAGALQLLSRVHFLGGNGVLVEVTIAVAGQRVRAYAYRQRVCNHVGCAGVLARSALAFPLHRAMSLQLQIICQYFNAVYSSDNMILTARCKGQAVARESITSRSAFLIHVEMSLQCVSVWFH